MTQVEGGRSMRLRRPAGMSLEARAVGAAIGALALLAASPSGAQDQSAPPCPPALLASPAFAVVDEPESGGPDSHDYASHPMMISAAFPLAAEADTSSAVWTLPATFTVLPPAPVRSLRDDTDSATVEGIPQTAGSYPATVTWTQTDGTHSGRCSGSASTSFVVTAATAPKLRRP